MPLNIWHQSMTDLDRLPGYRSMLREHAERIAGGDFSVDLHGVAGETYPEGFAPVEMTRFRWAHSLVFNQIIANVIRAEEEGYAAVAISCFIDPGLELARSAVDIPVVSSCETALLVAGTLGSSIGLITIDRSMVAILRELCGRYGYADRVNAISLLEPAMDEFELDEAFAGRGPLFERFAAAARRQIEAGVDVLVPAEGVLNLALVRNGIRDVDGVPVLDSYGALLRFSEMQSKLSRAGALAVSRHGIYAKAPRALMDRLRALTGQQLIAAGEASSPAAVGKVRERSNQ